MITGKVITTEYHPNFETNEVDEVTLDKKRIFKVINIDGEKWLKIDLSFMSLPLDKVPECIEKYGGWSAQAGTKPVHIPPCTTPENAPMCCGSTCQRPAGGWGGRNFPKVWVEGEELQRIYDELKEALTS